MKLKLNGNPKETDIQSDILHALGQESAAIVTDKKGRKAFKKLGVFVGPKWFFWRANSGMFRGAVGMVRANPAGTADILGSVNGQFVALEVKRPGKKQSESQKIWQTIAESSGVVYAVVESVGEALDVVRRLING